MHHQQSSIFMVTPSLGGSLTKTEESPLPMGQNSPRRMPTRYFKALGRAIRYYTLFKGDLEVVVANGNLILPRRDSTTGCILLSFPGHYYYYYYLICTLTRLFSKEKDITIAIVDSISTITISFL